MIITEAGLEATPNNFALAEASLREQLGADTVFWSGRAATALYHAYQLAQQRAPEVPQPEIIMPAMMCATAANTAHLAGVRPRFADIDPQTGLVTLETIQARYNEHTIAVVIIHLLGHLVDIAPIADWCHQNNLLLIEDPTQALGATFEDGRFAGSDGDVTIYSFNRTKIIHAGNGVLLSHTPETTNALCDIAAQPFSYNPPDDNLRPQLGLSYRNLHHGLVGLLRARAASVAQVSEAFLAVRPAYESLFLCYGDASVRLNDAWQALPSSLMRRLTLANQYEERLGGHPAWTVLTGFRDSGVCWRFSLLLHDVEQQVAFSEAVRRDGFHVSNLYWAVNQFFAPDDVCEGADTFSRQIVNLWVDHTIDAEYVEECCDSLLRHAEMLSW